MLIHTTSKNVLLNLSDPARVLTVIPSARQFDYRGAKLVAVPHKLDEARVLRNMGFGETPSPIRHYYKWPGRYQPFKAQLDTAEFLTFNRRAFVLNDLGTGKTLAALWAYDYLRSIGVVKKMLVVSPLSTLERTWADEVFNHFAHLSAGVLHGTKAQRLKVLNEDHDIYLINHDGLTVLGQDLLDKEGIDIVVVDEIASFRNASTVRWKALNKVTKGKEWLWGMTGTPTPNAPSDAWGQCRLVVPGRVPAHFGGFRDTVMRKHGPFKWVARDNASVLVADAMSPAIRFSRDECVDLPPVMYQDRYIPLGPEQATAYKAMMSKLKMEAQGQQVVAFNEAVKLSKLLQIACGVVYDTEGNEVVLPNTTRINETIETIEQAGGKTIVFVPYKSVLRHVADQLREHFKNQGFPDDYVAQLSGETAKGARDEIFRRFQQDPTLKVLVAQPAAMSHGLTLTEANTIVWWSPVTSQETYAQANGRITRPGQKQHQFIVNIGGSPVETKLYKRLKEKAASEGLLLDLIQEER